MPWCARDRAVAQHPTVRGLEHCAVAVVHLFVCHAAELRCHGAQGIMLLLNTSQCGVWNTVLLLWCIRFCVMLQTSEAVSVPVLCEGLC
eukprot:1158990-Pelagomonas_calceolata.AAC.10